MPDLIKKRNTHLGKAFGWACLVLGLVILCSLYFRMRNNWNDLPIMDLVAISGYLLTGYMANKIADEWLDYKETEKKIAEEVI